MSLDTPTKPARNIVITITALDLGRTFSRKGLQPHSDCSVAALGMLSKYAPKSESRTPNIKWGSVTMILMAKCPPLRSDRSLSFFSQSPRHQDSKTCLAGHGHDFCSARSAGPNPSATNTWPGLERPTCNRMNTGTFAAASTKHSTGDFLGKIDHGD